MKQASMETTGTLDTAARPRDAKPGTSPVLYFGLAVALGLGAVMIMHDKKPSSLVSRMPQAPELLAARAPCADQGAAALARGAESEQAAIAKAERHAFDAHDGVDAAKLYGLSASCYAQGGDAASAQRASAAEAAWRERVTAQYQSHRLRLRLALDRGANDEAYRQARALRVLFRTQTGPYVEWLAAIERTYKPADKKRGGMGSKKKRRS
jgi:hypothetical protein